MLPVKSILYKAVYTFSLPHVRNRGQDRPERIPGQSLVRASCHLLRYSARSRQGLDLNPLLNAASCTFT